MAIKAEPQSYILKAENKEPSKTLMGINERRLKLGKSHSCIPNLIYVIKC